MLMLVTMTFVNVMFLVIGRLTGDERNALFDQQMVAQTNVGGQKENL